MYWGDTNIKIADHPLGIQVQHLWDKLLPMFGFDKDVSVCSIPKKRYNDICILIDAEVAPWFEPFRYSFTGRYAGDYTFPLRGDNKEYDNLLNAWNYKARHTPDYKEQ